MASTLTTTSILQGMADAIPTHESGDETSDLASSYEAIGLLIHAYLAALDFRLCGFQEDKSLRTCAASLFCHANLPAECDELAPRLPPQWNASFGSLSFLYKHKQSSMRFLFKIDKMGAKIEVRGLAVGDENIHRVERPIRDVVNSNALPVRITLNNGAEDRADLAEKLRSVFVSDQVIAGTLLMAQRQD